MDKENDLEKEAWKYLNKSVVHFQGKPVGTVASLETGDEALNYDQCFTRDFAVSAMAFLMKKESEIVKNFLIQTLKMQSFKKQMDCFSPGMGLMPASFAIEEKDGKEMLLPDFGERAIARVAPVDSGFWWLIILRAYVKATGDISFAHQENFQKGIRLIIELYLTVKFEMLPTLLVPDGSYMIDRRLAVYGHPIDVQSLFVAALKSARELLLPGDGYLPVINERLGHLVYHIRTYYWLNMERINQVYRFHVEEFGEDIENKFNIYPASIPEWLQPWMPYEGGYFAGNLGPGRMDFRYFAQGNLYAIIASLADKKQIRAIVDLIDAKKEDLIGEMPLKIAFPSLKGREWEILTGFDQKNISWSYHNGGNWPFLLWILTVACVKAGRGEIANEAVHKAEKRLSKDGWTEYYDGPYARYVGKESRGLQIWTIAGYLVAKYILRDPALISLVSFDEDDTVLSCSQRIENIYGKDFNV